MPRTKIRAGMRSNASVTFSVTPDALMDAWMRQLNVHGCRSFWIYDVLFNIDKMHRLAKVAKEFGSEVAGSIMFTLSPVHTDEYYADKADKLSICPDIDTLLLYDTAGVLEKDRLKTLLPAIKAKARGKPIEFHSNNLLGQSAKAYLDAIELGVSIIHTAVRPMANGPSVPSVEVMARNVELMGHTHNLDTSLFAPVSAHFEKAGKAAGFLVNQYAEYDVLSIQHQIPGGMVGTMKAQLVQHGMSERLDEVMQETAIVRRELGYPGMATPFSQLVGTLAVLNIVTGKRYSVIPDEVIQYAAQHYGATVAPIEPNVLDKIMSAPRAKEICANPPEQPTLAELHKRFGTTSDDELILRALVPSSEVDKALAAGPVKTSFPMLSSPELDQVQRLMKLANSAVVQVSSPDFKLSLRRFS
jgi:oxaloacetate decarboxylase alpha subunit